MAQGRLELRRRAEDNTLQPWPLRDPAADDGGLRTDPVSDAAVRAKLDITLSALRDALTAALGGLPGGGLATEDKQDSLILLVDGLEGAIATLQTTMAEVRDAAQAIAIDADTIAIDADTINLSTDQLENRVAEARDRLPSSFAGDGGLRVHEMSPLTGFATSAKQDTLIAAVDGLEPAVGATTDAESVSGNGSLVGILKALRTKAGEHLTALNGILGAVDQLEEFVNGLEGLTASTITAVGATTTAVGGTTTAVQQVRDRLPADFDADGGMKVHVQSAVTADQGAPVDPDAGDSWPTRDGEPEPAGRVAGVATASGDTTVVTPTSGFKVRLRWVQAMDARTSPPPIIRVKLGGDVVYTGYAISKKARILGAVDQPVVINLDVAGEVSYTVFYDEVA